MFGDFEDEEEEEEQHFDAVENYDENSYVEEEYADEAAEELDDSQVEGQTKDRSQPQPQSQGEYEIRADEIDALSSTYPVLLSCLSVTITKLDDGQAMCDACSKVFKNPVLAKRHVIVNHDPPTILECKICGRVYRNVYALSLIHI